MLSQTRQEKCPVAQQSFGMYMYNVCIHCVVFELCMAEKERTRDEQNRNFAFGFPNFEKASKTYGVDLAIGR